MTKEKNIEVLGAEVEWINPIGGQGDMLMLSGVLKQVFDATGKQFGLVRRTGYHYLFKDHPAIKYYGFPPKGVTVRNTMYWAEPEYESDTVRAYQLLSRLFELPLPVEEKLFVNGIEDSDENMQEIFSRIPWKKKNVILSPYSESPRKSIHPMFWHMITEALLARDILVIQPGKLRDLHIKGAYNLIGLTNPRQVIKLVERCNLVISPDNFLMHVAHMLNKPAVVVWGPTSHKVYGYPGHKHVVAPTDWCSLKNECIGPKVGHNYPTPCPQGPEQCMNRIRPEQVLDHVFSIL